MGSAETRDQITRLNTTGGTAATIRVMAQTHCFRSPTIASYSPNPAIYRTPRSPASTSSSQLGHLTRQEFCDTPRLLEGATNLWSTDTTIFAISSDRR